MTRLVTLTTDIGEAYAAQMKAVLYRRLPPGAVVDLTHRIAPHAIAEAAFLLLHMCRGFPAGTVHLAVIDPGVGGERAPIAIATRDGSCLVGPDNGILAPLAEALGEPRAVRLDPARVTAEGTVSATFEGRDLFAPAAAFLATDCPLERLGPALSFQPYRIPAATRLAKGAVGEVLHIDVFGNAVTNVPTEWAPPPGSTVRVRSGRRRWVLERRRTYSDLAVGALAVLGSSFGLLEVSARERRAADRLRLVVGSRLRFEWAEWSSRRSARKYAER
jgi:S-adenosylmethionine hydrolase